MPELHSHLRVPNTMDQFDKTAPLLLLGVVPEPKAARRDPRVRRYAGHLREDEPRPAHGAGAKMGDVEVVDETILRRIHRHRRDQYTIRKREPAYTIGREHWRRC